MTAPQSSSRLRPFKPIPFGRYTLLTGLAAGGMGEVFLARLEGSAGFEKLCVIKKILPQLAEDPQFRERFLNEAKTLVHLQHGSIAQVLDSGLEDGEPFLAIEFVDGKDLRRIAAKVRERQQPMPLTLTLFVMSRVLDALAYAHRKRGEDDREIGLVHRDISPQNVLISYEGEVKVIDFGLAKSRLNAQKTHPSIVLGKFLYMAPEQARHQQVDRRTDLYAVGLCLYELLAGKNPFEGVHPGELMQKVSAPQIPALRQVDPLVPPAVDALVMRALAVDPEERYQSAEEFRTHLLSCLFEIDRNVGPENVSAFMREAFAAEYQTERRLLSGLREAAVATLAPPPSNPLQETGIFNALPPDELTPAPEASLDAEPSHKTVLEVTAPEAPRGPGRAPPPQLPPARPERKTLLDPRPKGMTEPSRPPMPPLSRAGVPAEPSRPPVPPSSKSAIPVAPSWDAPPAQGWVPEPKREVSRPPLPPSSLQEPKREPLRPAIAETASGRPTVEAPAVSVAGDEPKSDTDPRAEVVLPPVAADDTDPRVVVDELAKLRGEQDTQPRANVAELEAERNRAARVAARANRQESSAKLLAADPAKPAAAESAADRQERSGKLPAMERPESAGASPGADRQERSGKFAAVDRAGSDGASPAPDRQERSGKFAAAERAEGSGKFAAADRREASGKGLAADRQEGSGKGRPRPAARPTAAEPRHDTPLHTIEIPRAVAPRPASPPASRSWLLFAVGLLVPVLLGLAYVLFFHRPAQLAPAPGKLLLPPVPVAPVQVPEEPPPATGEGAAAGGEAPAAESTPSEAEAPAPNAPAPASVPAANAPVAVPEPAAPPAESLALPPTEAPKSRPAPTPSAPKKPAKKPVRVDSEGHREWLALKAAFERLKADRSCDSSGMGILCTRYRSLEKDVRAAEEAGTEDELIPRIKLLAAAVAEKAAE